MREISGRTEWERGKCRVCWVLPAGGVVRISGFAVARARLGRQAIRRTSGWARDYLRRAALADLGCAILGVCAAAQLQFGDDVTGTHIAPRLALPLAWLAVIGLAGGCDVRSTRTDADEFRKILTAQVGHASAIAVFSYVVNREISRGCTRRLLA